jgi:hypothetical protein
LEAVYVEKQISNLPLGSIDGRQSLPREVPQDVPDPSEHSLRPTSIDKLFLVAWFAIASVLSRLGGSGYSSIVWAAAACGAIVFLFLFRFSRRSAQQAINEKAIAIVQTSRPIVLYLRPFMTGGRLFVRNAMEEIGDRFLMGLHWDAELAITLALADSAQLVAVGDVRESLGAAKLQVHDAKWVEVMKVCADRAGTIIIVPLSRPSTMYEVDYIFRDANLLKKSLCFMAPTTISIHQLLSWLANRHPSVLGNVQFRTIPLLAFNCLHIVVRAAGSEFVRTAARPTFTRFKVWNLHIRET